MTTVALHTYDPSSVGVPYAHADVVTDAEGVPRMTATCPVCDEVFVSDDHRTASQRYADHYVAESSIESAERYVDELVDASDCELVVAVDRAEWEPCERSTEGCCVQHSLCEHDCETW